MVKLKGKNCSQPGCRNKRHARGFCDKHYRRLLKTGSPTPAPKPAQSKGSCSIPGCGRRHYALKFCKTHYRRHHLGLPMERAIRPTSTPPGEWGDWYTTARGYVQRRRIDPTTGRAQYQSRHRYEMEAKLGRKLIKGETVHHIDLNRSNNSWPNLQLRQGQHGVGAKMACMDCGSHRIIPVELD